MDSPALIDLEDVLAQVKDAIELDSADDVHLLEMIIRAIKRLNTFNLDGMGFNTWIYKLDPRQNFVIWPRDCIYWTRIGFIQGRNIFDCEYNPDIPLAIYQQCGVDKNPFAKPLHEHGNDFTYDGDWYGHNYSNTGGHSPLKYNEDKKKRMFVFQGSIAGNTVILEYVSSGISHSGKTYIPAYWLETVIADIRWNMAKNDARVGQNKVAALGEERAQCIREASTVEQLTFAQILQALYSGVSQGIRR
jgi:hypothetical protein